MGPCPLLSGHSLRGRLLRLLSVAVLLAAVVQAGLNYRLTRSEADEVFDGQMRQVALSFQGVASPIRPDPGSQRPADDDHLGFVIQVWNAAGECLFQSEEHTPLPLTPATGFARVTAKGRHYRVYSARTPARIIEVAQDLGAREKMAAALALQAVLPVLLLVPVLMAAVWLVVRRATRPILRVRDQVSSRAAEDLSPLPVAGVPEEVQPLVDEINLLFARLDRAFAAQRDFVADAAHELRTPLSALRLQAQGFQRASTEVSRAQASGRLLEGVDRASRLVEQMLVLARQESSAAPRAGMGLDLPAVATLAITDSLPAARKKGIDLGMAAEPGVQVLGQEDALRILVRNLLENAVKYTPEGGTVDLVIRVVEDSGPGIPPEEWTRVFDRFYRLPGQSGLGNGLGLAIVKAIAERLQGRVDLSRSTRLGGLEVSLSLPLHPGPPGNAPEAQGVTPKRTWS